MPKIKTAPKKKSTQTISTKRFKFTKLQVAFGVLILAIVGLVVVYKSRACTPSQCPSTGPWFYFWNTAGTSHQIGGVTTVGVEATAIRPAGTAQVWEERLGYLNTAPGKYMWYGPYSTVTGNTLQACWIYLPPVYGSASAELSVVWTDGYGVQRPLLPNDAQTSTSYNTYLGVGRAALSANHRYIPKSKCENYSIGGKTLTNVQVRVKLTGEDFDAPGYDLLMYYTRISTI